MLSNNGLCLRIAAQYMLLFLVLAVNSDRFKIYGVTCSYSSILAKYIVVSVMVHNYPDKLSLPATSSLAL